MELTRRNFLMGSGVLAGAAALASVGCAPATQAEKELSETGASDPTSAYIVEDFEADEMREADIVVMGTGMSGTAAILEAALAGKKVIAIEAAGGVGGNGQNTEGIAAVDSSMAKEQGVHVNAKDIIQSELSFFNYRVNALYWLDAIANSGENIDWMIENGAQFEGVIDNDRGNGHVQTFHWFKDRMGVNVIKPMLAAAEAKGAEILLNTRGVKLVMQDGRLAGIVAEQGAGKTLRINCPVVVFASGGYASNYDLMVKRGCPPVHYNKSAETNQGDALLMAEAAGGVNVASNSAMMFSVTIPSLSFLEAFFMQTFGSVLLVNGKGERFTDENCGKNAIGCYLNTLSTQDECYIILSGSIADQIDGINEGLGTKIAAACTGQEAATEKKEAAIGGDAVQDSVLGMLYGADEPESTAFAAGSAEDLAEALGIEPVALRQTIDRYNQMCDAGDDLDFGKDPATLVKIDEASGLFALRVYPGYATSVGAIKANRDYQVINELNEPIDGLYAVGCDGAMMWRETYTIEVPGSCNMNNVNSGRTAVKHAVANLL